MGTRLHFEPDQGVTGFATGVSLHSHTLHSHEPLSFICRVPRANTLLSRAPDLTRAYWTPPLAERDAWELERAQIEERLGMSAIVSLSDHDTMEAALSLRVLEQFRDLPVSVEWTVPYRNTFFHLGLHNIPAERARQTMGELAAYTANPIDQRLSQLLEQVASDLSTLVIFNHPCWDENKIGAEAHRTLATEFCQRFRPYLHAVEFNGLRPWKENREVVRMGEEIGIALISGGDRHGLEANTVLNLTNAGSISEFAEEVRGGASRVLVRKQYFEPFAARILQSVQDILADHENHGRGWVKWSDRVFYTCDDGRDRPLSALCFGQAPLGFRLLERALRAVHHPGLMIAFRALARHEAISQA